MTHKATVRQHDVTRVLRAARAAGLHVHGYEIDPATGRITVSTTASPQANSASTDLEVWLKKHGHKIYSD